MLLLLGLPKQVSDHNKVEYQLDDEVRESVQYVDELLLSQLLVCLVHSWVIYDIKHCA